MVAGFQNILLEPFWLQMATYYLGPPNRINPRKVDIIGGGSLLGFSFTFKERRRPPPVPCGTGYTWADGVEASPGGNY